MVLKTLTFIPDDNYLNTRPGSPPAFPPSPLVASAIACSGCTGIINRFNELLLWDWSRETGAVEESQDANPGGRNNSAGKANPIAEEQVTVMWVKVDLECWHCYEKIQKILRKLPPIRDRMYDETKNVVWITVVRCSPVKIRDKIISKGGETVQAIEIIPYKPNEPEKKPEKPKEPEKKREEPKELEKLKEPEKKPAETPKEPKIRDKIICKGGKTVQAVEIMPYKPNEPEKKPEKPKEPEKKREETKEPEKLKKPEKKPAETPKEPKIRDKIICKGGETVQAVEIMPYKPNEPEKKLEKPKEPEKKREETKEPEKLKEPEKKPAETPKEPKIRDKIICKGGETVQAVKIMPYKPNELEKKPEKPKAPEKKREEPKQPEKLKEPEKKPAETLKEPKNPKETEKPKVPEKPQVAIVEAPKEPAKPTQMAEVTAMLVRVDLQLSHCFEKITKILCEFPQIRDQLYDEKENTVLITMVCCSPEKIRDRIICKGGKMVQGVEILPYKPNELQKKPEKPEELEKKPKEPKEPEKLKEPEKKPAKMPKEPRRNPRRRRSLRSLGKLIKLKGAQEAHGGDR